MRKKQWMCLFAGLLALMLAACNNDETTSCNVDADCDTTELCHPNVKLCVKTCTSSDDCPASAKTCGTLATTDGEKKICQCSTDYWCNDGKADGDLVCDETYKVCVPKGTETDEDPGVTLGGTCDASKPQPDVCKYGLVCGSDNKCEAPPAATCDYFPTLGWDPLNPSGPVIYSARLLSFHNDNTTTHTGGRYCQPNAPWHLQVELKAYSTGSQLVSRDGSTPLTIYLSKTKAELWTDNVRPSEWVNDGPNHATIIVNACYENNSSHTIGVVFNNGNTVCVSN
jgi:hypothetical protein